MVTSLAGIGMDGRVDENSQNVHSLPQANPVNSRHIILSYPITFAGSGFLAGNPDGFCPPQLHLHRGGQKNGTALKLWDNVSHNLTLMKELSLNVIERARLMFQLDRALKGRSLSFKVMVITICTVDIICLTFCLIKMT
jgi:hypothetical protein